jgi:hypothetical protein
MNNREMAFCLFIIALAGIFHFLMRFTVSFTGEMQATVSIAVYCMIALLIPMSMKEANVVGFVTGLVLMTATAAPFPLANIPSHWCGLLSCKIVADKFRGDKKMLGAGVVSSAVLIAAVVSFFLFVIASYYGILALPDFAREGMPVVGAVLAGKVSFGAFLSESLLKIGIPTMIVNAAIAPVLYSIARRCMGR